MSNLCPCLLESLLEKPSCDRVYTHFTKRERMTGIPLLARTERSLSSY
jgi:hypothetical protein